MERNMRGNIPKLCRTKEEERNFINEESAASYLLSGSKLNILDAARLIMELLEESSAGETQNELVSHCRHVIHLGVRAHEAAEQTVSFREAVEALKVHKSSLRERTFTEIRQMCRRVMDSNPKLCEQGVRHISATQCQMVIENTFPTVPMRRKAKRILHSLFSFARLNGWCADNPLDQVVLPPHKEKPISALTIDQVIKLLEVAKDPEHILCAPALGLMMWAGIRPYEILRLHVSDLHFDDRVITVQPEHSKTGGARQVTMYPVLYYWLRDTITYRYPSASIAPPSWPRRWSCLREEAGFDVWIPDILRHTFASYHLKYYKNLSALQLDMGHSTLALLRTRYLAMQDITMQDAEIFWHYNLPTKVLNRIKRTRDKQRQQTEYL